MKTRLQTLCLTVCALLLLATCRPEEPEIYERPLFHHSHTDYVGNSCISYVQIGDSIHKFDFIEGSYYSCRGRENKNVFSFWLLNSFEVPVNIAICTEIIKPEIFFHKGTWENDSVHVSYEPLMIGGVFPMKYSTVRSVLTWDTAHYENRTFKGKGSFEIKDTLYTKYTHDPDTYFPPQKIEFEFE